MSVTTQIIPYDSPEACGLIYKRLLRKSREIWDKDYIQDQVALRPSSEEHLETGIESWAEACARKYRELEEITGKLVTEGLLEQRSIEVGSIDTVAPRLADLTLVPQRTSGSNFLLGEPTSSAQEAA